MFHNNKFIFIVLSFLLFNNLLLFAQNQTVDPIKDDYVDYVPDFAEKAKRWKYTDKEMERSSEIKYYSLNEVEEINRANALVKVAIESEESGDYRKAMNMYQDIITRFSIANDKNEVLYRVSPYGVFVPVAQYCQRRILNFPKEHLDFYRTLRDPEAKERFDEAVKKYSLDLFSEIVDKYLATSYGGKALLFLGDAALDRGNYLEALEYFGTILTYIPDKNLQTPELRLKIQFCEKALGQTVNTNEESSQSNISEKDLELLKSAIQKEIPAKAKIHTQRTSNDYISGDDYTRFKPTTDPLGLATPEWENDLLASRNDYFIYAQPVVTDTSVVVRMKNIIYCYSIINGNLRWKNDMGGKAVWQDWVARQYPLEDVVIQDGVVVTPIYKGGSSLVALDEITGQIKWSYGPMSASDGDESLMRFECAPAAGPGTIYANYVLDNIKGDTHIDSEYGVIAFESGSGRIKWRRQICRMQPGKFDGSFGNPRKNRIRSFFTPPLYHEGTVYFSTNAGAVAAMDSLSGRIKWLMRYPYYPSVHDLTRQFGTLYLFGNGVPLVQPHSPMFWLNQRPLVVGENLYVLPVNSPFMLCIDRKNGKVNWTFDKPTSGFNYFLGPISTGELVITGNGRKVKEVGKLGDSANMNDPLYLVDPKTGKITWKAPDIIMRDDQPVMSSGFAMLFGGPTINIRYFETSGRPFLMEDDRIIITCWADQSWRYNKAEFKYLMGPASIDYWAYRPGMHVYALCELDLVNKKILNQRRYYSDAVIANADQLIHDKVNRNYWKMPMGAPLLYEDLSKIPRKTPEQEAQMAALEKVMQDTVPVNQYPAFMPFSRLTFNRFGIPFELRISPRKISMIYNRGELEAKLLKDDSLPATFCKSELSVKDGDFKKASEYLNQCLALVSPEDINFRALIKLQFYKVYLELVRTAIRSNKPKMQMDNTIGMSNTASVLAEEVETLFALTEAYINNDNYKSAASCLRTLIEVYGQHEFPISSLAVKTIFYQDDLPLINDTMKNIFTEAKLNAGKIYKGETEKALDLTLQGFPLFLSSVSPLPKELKIRAGDLAIIKLAELLKKSPEFEAEYSKIGDTELAGDKIDQLIFHLWKYPNTSKGQEVFDRICALSLKLPEEDKRVVWRKLGHMAKICRFTLPKELVSFFAIPEKIIGKDLSINAGERSYEVGNFKDGIMIAMERDGDQSISPNLMFVGVKLPKKIGFRFSVVCFDLSLGKEVWRKDEFRLKDLGKEPGFYKAYVYKDMVVVNGLYDVFAFNLKDGAEIWHYKTPYSFEIYEATMSGNIFVLSGDNETIALQLDTKSPIGEVAWQQKEDGNIYFKPYFFNDVLISVRKFPFNITSRHRTTGSLMAQLSIPDLSQVESHPLLKEGEPSLPIACYGHLMVVTDEKYILLYDIVKMELIWKALLQNVDLSKDLKMRIVMNDKNIILVKEDYDLKAIYCYDVKTGEIKWKTDPDDEEGAQPIYSLLLEGDTIYGIGVHPGQGFYFASYDCEKGALKNKKLIEGYGSIPLVKLRSQVYGNHVVVEVQDRKDFQLLVLDKNSGEILKKVADKGDGPIGEVGRVSMTVQDGHPILFSKTKFSY